MTEICSLSLHDALPIFLEFWLIGLIFWKLPMAWRLVLAVFVESTWEVVENTNYVINRYREATISLEYFGDSIVNSRSEEHTSELQSQSNLVCRLLLEKK